MVWWKSIKERYQMSEWEIVEESTGNASIKVVGVGGGGGNAVQHMVDVGIEGANFISVNTDKQALDKNGAGTKLVLGMEITDGLGAGADPQVGREAALEDRDKLKEQIWFLLLQEWEVEPARALRR
jgi:cell division protein FtsZ